MYKNNLKIFNVIHWLRFNVIHGPRPVNLKDHRIKSGDDLYWKRLLNTVCNLFKYPSPDTIVSTSPSGGEVLKHVIRPQCAPDATKFLSDVYKRSTRAQKSLVDGVQCGRSMIEMLGVLAIVGVLSVGGIAGYSKAMMKWKINKNISDYTYFMFKSIEHLNDLYKIPSESGYADVAQSLDMLPDSWDYVDTRNVRDALNYRIQMWNIGNELVFEIYLSENNSSKILQHKRFCQEFFSNFAKPLSTFIRSIYIWRSNAPSSVRFYGDNSCGEDKKCLKDITLSEIDSLCAMSMVDKGGASIVLHY